jgi:acetoacetyl-CoA reductase
MAQRVAIVTGGMGGLGEAICIKLSKMGYKVVTTFSPGNTKAKDWLAEMKRQGHDFHSVAADVADFDACAKAIKQIESELGPIDVLVNNAGITRDMTFRKMTKTDWDAVMRTNLDSVFNMAKPVCDGMVDRGWGRIINVSSVNGQKGAFGQTNYSAAKAGMHGFTKALALEVARKGVTVNTISPGYSQNGDGDFEEVSIRKSFPVRTPRRPKKSRGSLSVLGRSGIRDRRQHRDQRRPAHAVDAAISF